jgi:DMSO/TMAO reductase YedYZ molybdopterin-dependent catalytic subunit
MASAFAAEPALRIDGVAGRDGIAKPATQLSLSDLQSMPRAKARVKMRDGKEHLFEGVAVAELLKKAGQPQGEELRGSLLSRYILITAHDGYRAVFSLPEFDPAFDDTEALLADRMDGEPIPTRDGPLRLILPKEKRESRWMRMVERIEVVSTPEPVR